MILLFFPIYIIIGFVKEFTLQKFFYITPYLIIYTPLETPGSSPTGCFSMQRTGRRNDLIIVVPAACFLSIDGVHMHHAVLYVFEFIFDGMMHIFRNIMCIVEGYFSCRRDLDIHVHFGSEKAGSKKIHSSDARHLEDLTLQ